MSKNHQFLEFSENVVKRYAKTVPYVISGYRLNPHNPNERLDFILKTPENNFDFQAKKLKGLDYETEVIELYSTQEANMFLRLNKNAIERGLLKEYDGTPNEVSTENLVNDAEILELASIKAPNSLKSRLKTITSTVVVERILDKAIELGRSVTIIKLLEDKLDELT